VTGALRPLSAWPLSRALGVAFAWTAMVLLVAFLTPPGRFLIWLYGAVRSHQPVTADMPVTALKIWFIVVPLLAFGPPAAFIAAWLRAHGVGGGKGGV
jgi:hypothetical protein